MDVKITAVLIGTVAGGVGYFIATFWIKPIVNYIELRSKVAADLIFYAQVVNAEGLDDRMRKLYEERILANRRHAADLAACLMELPFWYRWYLHIRGCSPRDAVSNLIGFSNTTDYDIAEKRIGKIKAALGLRTFHDD